MRAGIAAGRALFCSLHRFALKPQLLESSSILLPKSSSLRKEYHGLAIFRNEHHGMEFQSSSSFGHRRSPSFGFSVSGIDGAPSMGYFRPTAQNHVFLQGHSTQTSTPTPSLTPLDLKALTETKVASVTPSASPPPPPTGVGNSSETPKSKKWGVVKQMFLDFRAVPFPALILGMAGLIPFVALAPPLAHMLPLPALVAAHPTEAQALYGASIVSFLGAIHWGLAMADYAAPGKGGVASMTLMTMRYVWSVVPSLLSCTALLLPGSAKFALLISSLWMVLGMDFIFARLKLVPLWFLSLRWPLTLVASVSMIPSMAAAATWAYP